MRSFVPFFIAASLLLSASARAEDAADLEAKGIAALKLSQNDADAVVSAAIYFGQASELYQAAKNDDKATEMNSFLYWCKKKMTLQQMDEFLKGGSAINAAVAKRMKEIEAAPQPDEAQTYFNRAETYANAHPNEHLLIAVRFYEVADRFKGTDLSLQAQDRLLKEITLEKTGAANASAPARENPAAPPAVNLDPTKKVAVPAAAKLKDAEKTVRDLYKDEFAKSAPKDKAALAAKLEKQADESANDPSARYVLLTQAATLAAQAGELERLSAILDKLSAAFESDFKDFKKAQLSAALSKITDAKLAKVASALKVLIDKPDDAAANLIVGKYKLQAGDIEHAAAFISKSKNAALMELMKQEQAPPTDGAAQAALGDAWWELSEKSSDKDDKIAFATRASHWYRLAMSALTGLVKAKIEKRVAEFEASLPKPEPINLLKMIDPEKNGVTGKWKFKGEKLISDNGKLGVIEIPYVPPEEYDFIVVFKRFEANDFVMQIMAAGGSQFTFGLGVWGNAISGFETVNGEYVRKSNQCKGRTS